MKSSWICKNSFLIRNTRPLPQLLLPRTPEPVSKYSPEVPNQGFEEQISIWKISCSHRPHSSVNNPTDSQPTQTEPAHTFDTLLLDEYHKTQWRLQGYVWYDTRARHGHNEWSLGEHVELTYVHSENITMNMWHCIFIRIRYLHEWKMY